jgi:hypothetical protein
VLEWLGSAYRHTVDALDVNVHDLYGKTRDAQATLGERSDMQLALANVYLDQNEPVLALMTACQHQDGTLHHIIQRHLLVVGCFLRLGMHDLSIHILQQEMPVVWV